MQSCVDMLKMYRLNLSKTFQGDSENCCNLFNIDKICDISIADWDGIQSSQELVQAIQSSKDRFEKMLYTRRERKNRIGTYHWIRVFMVMVCVAGMR